jgi:hypothetical protein
VSWIGGYLGVHATLRRGLDGALSAVSAQPAGQVAQGFIIELLAWASQLEQ